MEGGSEIDHGDIVGAIARLHRELPGWWWSIGWCHVSNDCSIAVDGSPGSPDLYLIASEDKRFDEGFHNDIVGGDVAEAMHGAIDAALQAKAAMTDAEKTRAREEYERSPVAAFMRGHLAREWL